MFLPILHSTKKVYHILVILYSKNNKKIVFNSTNSYHITDITISWGNKQKKSRGERAVGSNRKAAPDGQVRPSEG